MVQQKAKLKQQKAAQKRAEKTLMAAPMCAIEKKFRHLCRTKSIDLKNFKEQQTEEQQIVELTTSCSEALSRRRSERQYGKAHEFMKKKR